jgi:hypothetical protein
MSPFDVISDGRATESVGSGTGHATRDHVPPDREDFHRGTRRFAEDKTRPETDAQRCGKLPGQTK